MWLPALRAKAAHFLLTGNLKMQPNTNHIILRRLDPDYHEALCGAVLLLRDVKLPVKRYNLGLDWKANVNCQPCLKRAWEIIRQRTAKKP